MMHVGCFKWRPANGYRSEFSAECVNVLKRMVARHYKTPHEFFCVTDDAEGIDSDIRVIPLWDDYAKIPSPHGGLNPSCYRRLKVFSREAREIIGERFALMDLDVVITRDITSLLDTDVDFAMYGDTAKNTPYNGSLMLMNAGARPEVWEHFDPILSPQLGRQVKYIGSDQAWIGYKLGPNERKFTKADGVYSYRNEILNRDYGRLPKDARIVVFHGHVDPWQATTQARHAWVKEHYR